jgi:hypothetical protein
MNSLTAFVREVTCCALAFFRDVLPAHAIDRRSATLAVAPRAQSVLSLNLTQFPCDINCTESSLQYAKLQPWPHGATPYDSLLNWSAISFHTMDCPCYDRSYLVSNTVRRWILRRADPNLRKRIYIPDAISSDRVFGRDSNKDVEVRVSAGWAPGLETSRAWNI